MSATPRMTEPTLTCPNCGTEIKLTESLAAPLIQATRQEFEARLKRKDEDMARREQQLREQQASLDEQVAEKLRTERARIAADEQKKARFALASEIDQKGRELIELQSVLKQRDEKLAEAQQAQAAL